MRRPPENEAAVVLQAMQRNIAWRLDRMVRATRPSLREDRDATDFDQCVGDDQLRHTNCCPCGIWIFEEVRCDAESRLRLAQQTDVVGVNLNHVGPVGSSLLKSD